MLNIYIAGASAEIERCEAFRDACVAMGYTVPHDWCAMVRNVGAANGPLPVGVRRAAKNLAYAGASTCDVFALLLPGEIGNVGGRDPMLSAFSPRGQRVHTVGAWWELAIAEHDVHHNSAARREMLIVGDAPERTVMTVDLPHAWTDAEALDWLRVLAAKAGA